MDRKIESRQGIHRVKAFKKKTAELAKQFTVGVHI
jgi:hypothetical protein